MAHLFFGGVTSVASVNLGASLAYKVNDRFSIGGGIDVIYGSGELYRDMDVGWLGNKYPQAPEAANHPRPCSPT